MIRIVISLVLLTTFAFPQEIRRFEFGAHTTMLRTNGDTASCGGCPARQWAIGPAMTLNLNRTFAIDGAASLFPGDSRGADNFRGGHLSEALIGLKASIRNGRWTLFAKARPGFASWSRAITGVQLTPSAPTPFSFDFGRKTYFAADFGGGIVIAATQRLSARIDLGSTAIRFSPGRTSNNLQISSGVYYGAGAVLISEARIANPDTHKFVDRTNVSVWTASLLAQTADAIATQRTHANCLRNPPFGDRSQCREMEANPLARPFVSHGWSGQIGLAVIVNTAQIGTQYVLHRWGHHRVERVLPVPLMIGNIHGAYQNLQTH